MISVDHLATEIVGRIAYVDPSNQWGYLHGPAGERVYFHATNVLHGIAQLQLGAEVCYRVAASGDQLCAVQVVHVTGIR
jgi:cold shock CspA family protein